MVYSIGLGVTTQMGDHCRDGESQHGRVFNAQMGVTTQMGPLHDQVLLQGLGTRNKEGTGSLCGQWSHVETPPLCLLLAAHGP